jgi:ATP-dependent Clp protease ATP-binding subunit ClpA
MLAPPIWPKNRLALAVNAASGEDTEAINRMFTPEFRNRLDAVVPFDSLPTEVVVRVVEKFILELEMQLADRNVIIEVSEPAMNWLVEQGYDPQMGARPLARIIQENIKKAIGRGIAVWQIEPAAAWSMLGCDKAGALTFKFSDGDKPEKASIKPAKK